MRMQRLDSVPEDPTQTEEYYRRLLGDLARSGQTQREFARRQKIPAGRLAWWRHEIARRDRVRGERAPAAAPALLPVRVVSGPPSLAEHELRSGRDREEEQPFEVRLAGSGHAVRIPAAFDPERLALLVRTLEVASC